MENLAKYRDWLVRARGIADPSEDQVRRFKAEAESRRPRGSILDLALIAWLDRGRRYSGTRRYLAGQGLVDPSQEDLFRFHRKMVRALIWRGAVGLSLIVVCWAYLWWVHVLP